MAVASTRERVRADGTIAYVALFRHKGKQTSETFNSDRARARFIRNIDNLGVEAALEILDATDDTSSDMPTVAQWATEHVDNLAGVQEDTRNKYRRFIRRDLGPLATLPVDALTEDAVGRWVTAMAETGAAGKTIQNKHGFLSSVMERAVRRGLVPSNPCRGTRIPRTEQPPMVFLTHEEYAVFLDYITPYWQPLVTTLFSTGLRWGEVTALQVRDLDLDRAALSVVRAWKDDGSLGPPKSRKSRRTIALAPETVELLREVTDGRSGEEWVFLNQRGDRVRGSTFHENVWQPAVRLANGEPAAQGKRIARRRDAQGRTIEPAETPLGKRPRVHDARHTAASWLLASGIPINYVQAHLGHESITTTVDRYGHIMPAAHQAIAGAMSAALAQAHPQVEPGGVGLLEG